jgi:hypothetical protein
VTLVWFVVWLIWNNVGDKEPLTFDPVNWWTGLLLLAVALDLGGGHAHVRAPLSPLLGTPQGRLGDEAAVFTAGVRRRR